jgi:hemolysin activation/secretion protein
LVLTGDISVAREPLQALVREAEGQTLTLGQLQRFADRITEWYRERGYPFARAYIPAQTIDQGQVEILVMEGRYGELRIDNRSGVQGDGVIARTLRRLQSGDPIRQPDLDRTLLLLQDIPGVDARGSLRPGAQVGSSDLEVQVDKAQAYWASATVDNSGSSSLGRKRLSGTLGMAGLLGTGDTLTLNMLGSGSSSLKYHRIAYESLVDGNGTRVGVAYSDLLYRLIGSFSSLEAHGTANVSSLWLRHPLLRSRDANLNLQLQQEHVKLRDRIELTETYNDRHLRVSTLTLSGDLADGLLGGAQNTASLSAVAGNLSFDNELEGAADLHHQRARGRRVARDVAEHGVLAGGVRDRGERARRDRKVLAHHRRNRLHLVAERIVLDRQLRGRRRDNGTIAHGPIGGRKIAGVGERTA